MVEPRRPRPEQPRILESPIRPPISMRLFKEEKYKKPKKIKIEVKRKGYQLLPTLANVEYKYKTKNPKKLSQITGFEILR
jgi:hypothetical protein